MPKGRVTKQEQERRFKQGILGIRHFKPNWQPRHYVDFIQKSPNRPKELTRQQLRKKVSGILRRGRLNDKPRSGRPRTVSTPSVCNRVVRLMKNKSNDKRSVRKTTAILKKKGINISKSSVGRIAKRYNLKFYKKRKTQKLTFKNKLDRVASAKYLKNKFGNNYNNFAISDFSGKMTLIPKLNQHNSGYYSDKPKSQHPASLTDSQHQKHNTGIILWGMVTRKGVLPRDKPIYMTEWIKKHAKYCRNPRKPTLNGKLYSIFLNKVIYKLLLKNFTKREINSIVFEDDNDRKQRTKAVMEIRNKLFPSALNTKHQAARMADLWCIEHVWGDLQSHLQGQEYKSKMSLKRKINQRWREFGDAYCANLLNDMPLKVNAIIKRNGEQIKQQDYRINKNKKKNGKRNKQAKSNGKQSNNKGSKTNKRKTARKQSNYIDDSNYPPLRIDLDL